MPFGIRPWLPGDALRVRIQAASVSAGPEAAGQLQGRALEVFYRVFGKATERITPV